MSIKSLFSMSRKKNQYISFENIVLLFFIYITVLLGFGVIYTSFIMLGAPILIEDGTYISGDFFSVLQDSMYFSAITLFSVGYGDITPVGVGRWLSIIEALLGYIMPTAFVVRSVVSYERD
ncbi:two pore domain potassium channel family protein [Cytobacillus suaedae]|nr:two pore domain potassium channel family protein [Cytobacillus suaedae]